MAYVFTTTKDGICFYDYQGWHMFLRLPRMAYVFTTTKDGICSPGEGKEKERTTTYEMVLLHREIHEKGGVG